MEVCRDRTQVMEEFFVSALLTIEGQKVPTPSMKSLLSTGASTSSSDYVLLGRNGKPIAVVEAKKASADAEVGWPAGQSSIATIFRHRAAATCLSASTPTATISTFGTSREAPPQKVHGFASRQDLERLLHIRRAIRN